MTFSYLVPHNSRQLRACRTTNVTKFLLGNHILRQLSRLKRCPWHSSRKQQWSAICYLEPISLGRLLSSLPHHQAVKNHLLKIAELVHGPGDSDGVDRGQDQEQDGHGQQDGLEAHDDLHLADGATALAFDDPVVLPGSYADVPPCLQVSVAGSMGFCGQIH